MSTPVQAQAPGSAVCHYTSIAAQAAGRIGISAGVGALAACVFTVIDPIGGAIFGATGALTGLVAHGIMNAVGRDTMDERAFRITKLVVSGVLAAVAATFALAVAGFPITFTAAATLIAGMFIVNLIVPDILNCIACCAEGAFSGGRSHSASFTMTTDAARRPAHA
ncbi:MAG: hypothetical protein NTX49_00890 [Chlamydiae bacterium]|nr:hypothetical protein [Chlamydiota bacterium]